MTRRFGASEGAFAAHNATRSDENITLIVSWTNLIEGRWIPLAYTVSHDHKTSRSVIYQRCYHPTVSTILQPPFFASIGFSSPITLVKKAVGWLRAMVKVPFVPHGEGATTRDDLSTGKCDWYRVGGSSDESRTEAM